MYLDNVPSSSLDCLVRLQDVTFVRQRRVILDAVSWDVPSRSHWVVLGANGSGKTTLLQILAGYLWPTRGQVCVLGEEFGKVDLRELRKQIGWVGSFLQAQIPPSQKPLDLIVSGKFASIGVFEKPAEEDYRLAAQLAEQLRCSHILNSSYGVLSQGEKQRLLIARALIHHPRLVILDEACSGLDLVAREQLLQTLEGLTRTPDAPTLIYVTHHLEEIIPAFTHVLLLKGGQCVAQGRREEVLRGELLSDVFGIPLELTADGSRYWARTSSWQIPDSPHGPAGHGEG